MVCARPGFVHRSGRGGGNLNLLDYLQPTFDSF